MTLEAYRKLHCDAMDLSTARLDLSSIMHTPSSLKDDVLQQRVSRKDLDCFLQEVAANPLACWAQKLQRHRPANGKWQQSHN